MGTYRIVYDATDSLGPVVDEVEATPLSDGTYELTSHATYIPLGPGDTVFIDRDGVVTDVDLYERMFTFEVDFHLPTDIPVGASPTEEHKAMKAIARLIEQWQRQAFVTRTTNFTALVSSQTEQWIRDVVLTSKYVEYAEPIRTPATEINFAVAIKHPDLDGTRSGPWA